MPTPLSVEGRLLHGLEQRGMSVGEFARVANREGIPAASKTKLNEYFRDAAESIWKPLAAFPRWRESRTRRLPMVFTAAR